MQLILRLTKPHSRGVKNPITCLNFPMDPPNPRVPVPKLLLSCLSCRNYSLAVTTNFGSVMSPAIFHKFDINKSQNTLFISLFILPCFLFLLETVFMAHAECKSSSNKAWQTGVESRHLRGNYPPFAARHTINNRMLWSWPPRCTVLYSAHTICTATV